MESKEYGGESKGYGGEKRSMEGSQKGMEGSERNVLREMNRIQKMLSNEWTRG